jgi:hypothetical protein
MKIKMKKIALTLAAVVILSLFASTAISVMAKGGNPFDDLWAAITGLQTQIDQIKLIPGPTGAPGPQGPAGFGTPNKYFDVVIPDGVSHVNINHGLYTGQLMIYAYHWNSLYNEWELMPSSQYQVRIETLNNIEVARTYNTGKDYFRVLLWVIPGVPNFPSGPPP